MSVFNWKEKKILRLSLKREKQESKISGTGNWADIAHLFDEKRGDKKVDWDVDTNYSLEAVDEPAINTRKQVSMSLLFGPGKSFGLLPKRENVEKLRFSHSRVFGFPKKSLYNPTGNKTNESNAV